MQQIPKLNTVSRSDHSLFSLRKEGLFLYVVLSNVKTSLNILFLVHSVTVVQYKVTDLIRLDCVNLKSRQYNLCIN